MKQFIAEKKQFSDSIRLKQNNIDSLSRLSNEKQKQIDKAKEQINKIEGELAILRAEMANISSYKETFAFILRESLNWVMNQNNKLKHSVKTLNTEDYNLIKNVFDELHLKPF